jgi:hypothetical protein
VDQIRSLPALQPLRDRANWVLWNWTPPKKAGDKWGKPPFQIAHPDKHAANNRESDWGLCERWPCGCGAHATSRRSRVVFD